LIVKGQIVRVLDLYCCSGGAARGHQLAGAVLVDGVDVVRRSRYVGDRFFWWDAITFLATLVKPIRAYYDLIHA
jgi:DNA (cytosine-5)-methyltransferase 1